MKLPDGRDFIAIGENVHTTRALRRKGSRIVTDNGTDAVRFNDPDGEPALLPISEAAKATQDFRQGRVKHVKIALDLAMSADSTDSADSAYAAIGMTYLRALVRSQEEAGADFLDLNVDEISLKREQQRAAMGWLVRTVQSMSDTPVSIDSSSVEVIEAGLDACDAQAARPLLNSASLERPEVLDRVLAHGARVVVTAAGEKGMPDGLASRVENASRMVDAALSRGIALADIYVDPLIFPIAVDGAYGMHSLDAIRELRARYDPEIHITGGFSNVSFGIPNRKLVNDVFLLLALEAGADSGIIDPVASHPASVLALDRASETYRLAEDVLMGRDEHCQNYISAWRKGAFATS